MLPLHSEARAQYDKQQDKFKASANKGLLFARFYDGYDKAFQKDAQADTNALRSLVGKCGVQQEIKQAASRLHALISSLEGEFGVFSTDWHFVTGMGNSHPAESGFSWHTTLGTPYLPGAAVKGLLRAWMEYWVNADAPVSGSGNNKVAQWFGKGADKENAGGMAGDLIFFDALPVEQPTVLLDIMTPHMGSWYEQGGDEITPFTQPGDWHSPVPINFLVTSEARFLFGIAPRNNSGKAYVKEAMEQLKSALAWLGAGAKTAAGYGHMSFEEQDTALRFKSEQEQALIRQELAAKKHRERLAQANIASGVEVWPKARVSDPKPGPGEITISYDGRQVTAKRYGELSDAMKKRLKRGRPVYVEVEVEHIGNQLKVLVMRELPNDL